MNNLKKKWKVNIQSPMEQDFPFKCPSCGFDMMEKTHKYFIGWGNYPLGGFRNRMKPGKKIGVILDCFQCHTKSICHINDLNSFLEQMEMSLEIENERRML